jgi:hypothetical protein
MSAAQRLFALLTPGAPAAPWGVLGAPAVKTAASADLALLLRAKAESDRRNWAAKHRLLRDLLVRRPEDFVVDSVAGDIAGLTHRSGFRIHLPLKAFPAGFPTTPTPPEAPHV